MSQDVLPGLPEPRFDPREHGLYRRFVNGAGQIEHGQWLRAIAEGQHVGTCRRCGDHLIPQRPQQATPTRTDYQAECRDVRCGWVCCAPDGRYLAGSTRHSEQHAFFKRERKTTS